MADAGYQPFPDIAVWKAVPFDATTYEQYAALLEQARDEATDEAREHAVRTAIRYAGTDTGAIEGLYTTDRGFTRTVAIEAAHWETAADERGPNASQVIKDQIEAYEWLLDLVTEARPVTEGVIRELHAILCRSQETYTVQTEVGPQTQPLPKGEYKPHPNNPTSLASGQIHHYAPPDLVGPEVHRLVESLSSDEYRNAHPVVQAAYLHYSLVAIHPFADGNGRTTRALASVPLYRALRVPLIVFADERDEYLDALAAADAGDVARFVRFVAERVVDAVDLVVHTVRAGAGADEAASLERLRQVVVAPQGRTYAEMDALANRLLDAAFAELEARIAAATLPPGVSLRVDLLDMAGLGVSPPRGYRRTVVNARRVFVRGRSAPPADAESGVSVWPLVATDPSVPPLLLARGDGRDAQFSLRDVEPHVRAAAKIKIGTIVDAMVTDVLNALATDAAESLSRRGYR